MDKPEFARVAAFFPLCKAARLAKRGNSRSLEAARFMLNLEHEVITLEAELLEQTYRPRPYRQFSIADPKPRMISAAAFRDRVVHHALCNELLPLLESDAIPESFACRQGKGAHAAVQWAQGLMQRYQYVLKLDVRKFFASIDHDVLKQLLFRRIEDDLLRWLIATSIDARVLSSPAGKGLPIGNLTSQHFANFYLGSLDRLIKRGLSVAGYCRYMDDLLLFDNCKATLWSHAQVIEDFLATRLHLALRPEVTVLVPASEGVLFLGYRIWPRYIRLDQSRIRRFRQKISIVQRFLDAGLLSEEDAARSTASLIAWAAHAKTLHMRRSFFAGECGAVT